MSNMNKKITTVYVCQKEIDNINSLDELIQILKEAKEAGGVDVDISSEYESSDVELNVSYDREETDEECLAREKKEAKDKEDSLAWKRKEYQRLKKELGE